MLDHQLLVADHRNLSSLWPADELCGEARQDRYGLVLRAIPANGMARDVRLLFHAPICCPRELPQQMRDLLGRCPLTAENSGGA